MAKMNAREKKLQLIFLMFISTLSAVNGSKVLSSKSAGQYFKSYGSYVGRLRAYTHGISGQVYVVDDRHLFIQNFRYGSTGPNAYFWVGNTLQPSPKGHIVPYPPLTEELMEKDTMRGGNQQYNSYTPVNDGSFWKSQQSQNKRKLPPLQNMRNVNVLLRLPNQLKIQDIKWLSVWCQRFTVNYADVYIPRDIRIPRPMTLDQFPRSLDRLSSGRIRILDTKSFYIPNLFLRIAEPGYHFWVGNSTLGPDKHGQMVGNEEARFDDLKFYSGNNIILTLPNTLTVFDITYLAVYNEVIQDSTGFISFNVTGNRIPPALGQTNKPGWWFEFPIRPPSKPPKAPENEREEEDFVPFNHNLALPNCRELLGRRIRLLWMKQDQHIYFRIKVHMDNSQFAAVGIAATGSPNIEADIVKIYYNESSKRFTTQDSFLARRLFCDFAHGLCSDEAQTSQDNVRYMGSLKNHGLSVIDFKRLFPPGDMHDAPIAMDGPTQVIVAIGSLRAKVEGPANQLSYPSLRSRSNLNLELENTTIDFSSMEYENSCPDVNNVRKFEEIDPEEAWSSKVIKRIDLLVALLGPSGGSKGYGAITGNPPLEGNVVWWINGLLMPEIYVERGKTYYFRVQGGDSPERAESFHPFYITDHPDGGFGRKSHMERKLETIYAGVENLGAQPRPTGIGPLCEFVSTTGADKAVESKTFEDYKESLDLACEPERAYEYGWVNWTVHPSTPDLVYYQSYNGFGLGNKIHVVNLGASMNSAQGLLANKSPSFLPILLTTATVPVLFYFLAHDR